MVKILILTGHNIRVVRQMVWTMRRLSLATPGITSLKHPEDDQLHLELRVRLRKNSLRLQTVTKWITKDYRSPESKF